MNWTGGRLQRHSCNSGGKSLTAIQRQHFAKVRTKLQNGPRALSPLDFSLFHAAQDRPEDARFKSQNGELERHTKRQKTLCDYESTAALANRLSSMKPRLAAHSQRPANELRHVEGPAEQGYPNPHHGERAKRTPTTMPTITVHEDTDDLYDDNDEAGPKQYPQSSRRSLSATVPPENVNNVKITLEDQRKSLLQQEDWVGTAISRPLKISFPASKNKDKIGRRRKINEEDRMRRAAPPWQVYEPMLREQLRPRSRNWEDISVRIGGEFHGSQMTTLRGVEEEITRSQRHNSSPESMLLDREGACYGGQSWDLSPRNNLAGRKGQQRISEDSLWPSRMSLAARLIHSDSTSAKSDLVSTAGELPPKLYDLRDDQDRQALKDLGNTFQSGDLQQARQYSQSPSKQNHEPPAHHQERSTVSTRSAAEDNGVENLRNRNGEKCVSEDVVIQSEAFHQALSIAKAEPLRLIFGSTPPPASTAHPSENGSRGTQGMLGVRSTVTEASDDLEDAIVKGSDEMEWEKLVGVVELPKHAKSSSLGPAISVELAGLHQTNVLRPHDPRPDSNEAPQSQHDFQTLQVDDQVVTVADNNTFLKRTTRAQTEDEVWMKFLEIDGGDEEDDEEDHSPASYHRRVPESILAHASSTSFATTLTESSPFPNAKFASDNTGSPRTRGAAQNSPSAQASSADLRSVLATAHTSSPDPLAGGTYSVPSIASASVTAHSSSSISFAPPLTCTTLTPPPKSTAPKHTPNPQTSSPDPLTWTSPSMHLNHNNHHPTSHQTPTNTNPQKILFTKPTPFAGRHASKTTIHTPYGYNEPLHLGRNITGACSKFKVRRPKVKAKEKGGKAKGRRGQSKSAGHGRADRGRVSVYNLPDSEDGGGGREGEDEEDVEAIEDIE